MWTLPVSVCSVDWSTYILHPLACIAYAFVPALSRLIVITYLDSTDILLLFLAINSQATTRSWRCSQWMGSSFEWAYKLTAASDRITQQSCWVSSGNPVNVGTYMI